MTKDVHSICAP